MFEKPNWYLACNPCLHKYYLAWLENAKESVRWLESAKEQAEFYANYPSTKQPTPEDLALKVAHYKREILWLDEAITELKLERK